VTKESTLKKILLLVIVSTLLLLLPILLVHSTISETILSIHIKPDGSVDPANVPIQRNRDVYTLTDDIFATIVVERDDVIIDGSGYTLKGTYNGTRTDTWVVGGGPNQEMSNATLWTLGIDMGVESKPENLTVKNLNIKNFYIGIYLWTPNNTVTECAVTDNIVGILLSGDYNTITENYIANNDEGVFFGVNTPGDEPLNIILTHNSFVDNDVQFSGCFCEDYNLAEAVHIWDDGEKGNYWSDYNGTDTNGDGIGDTPYFIDILNKDRYPLIQGMAVPPTSSTKLPVEIIIAAGAVTAVIVAIMATSLSRKRRKKIET
jgi:hypothetical protein